MLLLMMIVVGDVDPRCGDPDVGLKGEALGISRWTRARARTERRLCSTCASWVSATMRLGAQSKLPPDYGEKAEGKPRFVSAGFECD